MITPAPDPALARLRAVRKRPVRAAAAALVCVLAAAAVLLAANPFAGAGATGPIDNGTPTGQATVTRRSLSSQTQSAATLGYANATTIIAPPGTAAASVQQAQQALAAAETTLRSAQRIHAGDERTLEQAQATLHADGRKEVSDCRGEAAAGAATSNAGSGSSSRTARAGTGSSSTTSGGGGSASADPCTAAAAATASAQQAVTAAQEKLTTDDAQVEAAQTSLSGAEQVAASARASETIDDPASVFTQLPAVGATIRRGQTLYAVAGRPVLLLYGRQPAWRAFRPGMSAGRDVAELNTNLSALGYGRDLAGTAFTSATEDAVLALQASRRLPQSGVLPLGSLVFEPAAVRVTTVEPAPGQPAQPGPVLEVTSLQHQVVIQLDASEQSAVRVGDRVSVTLPNNNTTPGVVSFVGTVATAPAASNSSNSGSGNASTTATIEIDVRLLHERAAGHLDQAPVQVSITTASVTNALVVPVDALLALTGGGYAVEVVAPTGAHQLEAVNVGLFDDAAGLVQVTGAGIHAGEHVVVPGS
jgi:hypothetical protein